MSAILPLVGVVIGGLLAGTVTYVLERRRERRSVRAAARLLAEELRRASSFIHGMLRPVESDWASRAFADLSTATWLEHRGLLASALAENEWERIAGAFEVVDSLHGDRWPVERQEEALEALDGGLRALTQVLGADQFWGLARASDPRPHG